MRLSGEGLSPTDISRLTGIPRPTVRDWVAGKLPYSYTRHGQVCQRCGTEHDGPETVPESYVYLLGLYLGDGTVSTHHRGVFRLRIFLDKRYPTIVHGCEAAMADVLPMNSVHSRLLPSNCFEVSCFSKAWPCLFPQHGPGMKHTRLIKLAGWQEELVTQHPKLLLRGLIHSDGCRFMNTGRGGWRCPRYSFCNVSDDIKRIFCDACDLLDLHWTVAPPKTVYVSRRADVARMDEFIGPKT